MFGYSMCLTDDKPLTKIKTFYYHCFKVNGPFVQTFCIEKDSYMFNV